MRRDYGHYILERQAENGARVALLEATVPPEGIHEHMHDEAQVILVTRGNYISSAKQMPGVSAGPVIVFNPPGTIHRDRFAAVGGQFVSICLPASAWDAVAPGRPGACVAHRMDIRAMATAYRLAAELARWDFASPLEHEAGCHALLGLAADLPRRDTTARPAWLERACERLREPDDATPTLQALADDAGVHPVHLARGFRRHLGCSPGAYLRRARLERAAQLMAGGAGLADAACAAGFHDQSHLHRILKAEVGLRPAALRTLIRHLA